MMDMIPSIELVCEFLRGIVLAVTDQQISVIWLYRLSYLY